MISHITKFYPHSQLSPLIFTQQETGPHCTGLLQFDYPEEYLHLCLGRVRVPCPCSDSAAAAAKLAKTRHTNPPPSSFSSRSNAFAKSPVGSDANAAWVTISSSLASSCAAPSARCRRFGNSRSRSDCRGAPSQ